MTTPKGAKWWKMFLRPPALAVEASFIGWLVFVIASGAGVQIGGPWNFSATGALGDSFGILSCLMASLAAIFTYQTLQDTREQRSEAIALAEEQKQAANEARDELKHERIEAEKRDKARDEASRRRDAEQTYFRLLELRIKVLEDVRYGFGGNIKSGSDALAEIVSDVENPRFNLENEVNFRAEYEKIYKSNINDLGHYFRFTYHIIRFAKDNFGRSAYEYIRLLRAQLANAEIVAIAMNCAWGEGQEKMTPLVERYSVLHNIDRLSRAKFQFNNYFKARAFDPEAGAKEKSLPPEDVLVVLDEIGKNK